MDFNEIKKIRDWFDERLFPKKKKFTVEFERKYLILLKGFKKLFKIPLDNDNEAFCRMLETSIGAGKEIKRLMVENKFLWKKSEEFIAEIAKLENENDDLAVKIQAMESVERLRMDFLMTMAKNPEGARIIKDAGDHFMHCEQIRKLQGLEAAEKFHADYLGKKKDMIN